MDKTKKFTPTKEEACRLADDYWKNLSQYSERFLDELSETIMANAKLGRYEVMKEILISEEKYIKDKLQDVGYDIELIPKDDKYDFIKVKFYESV
ncbi:hypothetical protein ACFO6R_05285 [Eubacterium multiforme]|uniref:TFIIF-interacting CTD phosphatase-like protein n=1 Tax=Eubacterium multiforme TaxID=83339 RepID=A0ABT9URN2_9FIRM|nr:hypothetical protein [Eubacterium multiforme]MDQ0148993.1 TFIIF-interacting CTD phosphatase-like protein [Eubacterium multiforme]